MFNRDEEALEAALRAEEEETEKENEAKGGNILMRMMTQGRLKRNVPVAVGGISFVRLS